MSQNMKDSEIVRNLVVFFGLIAILGILSGILGPVSYTHLRAHETS